MYIYPANSVSHPLHSTPLSYLLPTISLGVFEAVLVAVQQLSDAVQEELTPHIGALLIQINKKVFNRKYASQIQNTLAVSAEKRFMCVYIHGALPSPNATATTAIATLLIIQCVPQALDRNGGPDAYHIIKTKVPTYGA